MTFYSRKCIELRTFLRSINMIIYRDKRNDRIMGNDRILKDFCVFIFIDRNDHINQVSEARAVQD